MFENIDWDEQQKGVDEVKQGIGKWDISKITSFDNMFENVTVVDEKIIPQTQIMTQKLYNHGLEIFNFEKEKFERFLERNKNKSEKELKIILDKLNYGGF